MTPAYAIKQARRCNHTAIEHLKAGNGWCAKMCISYRNRWMSIARRPESF